MARRRLQVGDSAPDFTAVTDTGKKVKLRDYRGKRVVLYFYPRDNTPGCTAQACGFRDSYRVIAKHRGVVIGVSPDGVASHQKFKARQKLPFTLVADEDHAIATRYGVWGEKSMYGRKYMGMLRSHFVIDEKGKIVDAQVKVSPTDSVRLALQALAR
ncbi:MAG: thioredoxin-dependent thiol peroxidase [Candidatus Binatia bacterium]